MNNWQRSGFKSRDEAIVNIVAHLSVQFKGVENYPYILMDGYGNSRMPKLKK